MKLTINVVLPAVLGLVHVREAGIGAYQSTRSEPGHNSHATGITICPYRTIPKLFCDPKEARAHRTSRSYRQRTVIGLGSCRGVCCVPARWTVSDHAIISAASSAISSGFLTSNELEGLGYALVVRHVGGLWGFNGRDSRLWELNGWRGDWGTWSRKTLNSSLEGLRLGSSVSDDCSGTTDTQAQFTAGTPSLDYQAKTETVRQQEAWMDILHMVRFQIISLGEARLTFQPSFPFES